MVRMTNTFLMNGTEDPDEIIASTDHGVYVAELGGGQVNTATGDFVFGMTEAYLIEDGEITEPIREGNLIGNGPEVLQDIDALANDFAMGAPAPAARTARACRWATAADAAGGPPDHRRHRSVSADPAPVTGVAGDLLEIADRIVARPGATSRSRRRRPAAHRGPRYQGEVESLSSAESQGVGMRVVVGERQGFACAGTLDEDVIAEVIDEAATTPRSPPPTSTSGWPSPTACRPTSTCSARRCRTFPTGKKVDLALELERAVQAPTPHHRRRVGRVRRRHGRGLRGRPTPASARRAARPAATSPRTASPPRATRPRPGSASRSAASRPTSTSRSRAADAARRATRLLGATKPPSAGSPSCSTRYVTAQLLGIIGGTLSGEAVQKGRSCSPTGWARMLAAGHPHRRPHQPAGLHRVGHRRRGPRLRRNALIEGGVLQQFVHNVYTARKAGTAPRQRRAGRLQPPPRGWAAGRSA